MSKQMLPIDIKVHPIKVSRAFMKNYCYLIIHSQTKECVLVDPAWEKKSIVSEVKKNNLNLLAVLITHGHRDHSHLASYFSKRFSIPIILSKDEYEGFKFHFNHPHLIEHEAPFQVGSINIKPFFTPGHTKGSCCYLIDTHLFTGDTLFAEGCGMCFGNKSSPEKLYDSLEYIKSSIAPETKIFPGHSYGKDVGQLFKDILKDNLYLHFKSKETFVAYRMRKHQTGWFKFK